MRRTILSAAVLLCCAVLGAQTTSEQFKARHQRQVKNVGASGVGVENIIDRWEEAFPDDPDMLEARFSYYASKSCKVEVVRKDAERFLGNKPLMSIPDSTGKNVNFFQESFYDDSLFALGLKAIDRAIAVSPDNIGYRLEKITALLSYEKESPDLAGEELLSLIDYETSSHPEWNLWGAEVKEDDFVGMVQEYCWMFFHTGTPNSMETFKTVSERMNKLYPSNTTFIANLGSYWLVGQKNTKKALKCYNKVLKLDPSDYTAAKNCVLAARTERNLKLEKKYLPQLIANCTDEAEKASCEARLAVISGMK